MHGLRVCTVLTPKVGDLNGFPSKQVFLHVGEEGLHRYSDLRGKCGAGYFDTTGPVA